jgi:hypothetical protein
MGWGLCRKCGKRRKEGDYITDQGEHVPPCLQCGDPEYFIPFPSMTEVRDDDPPGKPKKKD